MREADTNTSSTAPMPLRRLSLEQEQEKEVEESMCSSSTRTCSESSCSSLQSSPLSPKPDEHKQQRQRRVTSRLKPHLASRVSFSDLEIREYTRTVGDHPGSSQGGGMGRAPGPPMSLDWKHQHERKVSVDEYEATRGPRRTKEQLAMTPQLRSQILSKEWGHSQQELKQAERKCQKVANQRQLTYALLPWADMEEAAQSIKRKTKRLVHMGRRDDILLDAKIPTQSEHGTSCTLAEPHSKRTSILVIKRNNSTGPTSA